MCSKRPTGGEWARWSAGLAIAALVSYLTAIAAIQKEVAVVKTQEESHFAEVLRRLEVLQADVREIRRGADK